MQLILGIEALFILFLISFYIYKKPRVGLLLLQILIIYCIYLRNIAKDLIPLINLGGINVYPEDTIITILLVASFYKFINNILAKKVILKMEHFLYYVILIFLIFSFIRGVKIFGTRSVFNEARGFYYFYSTSIFFFSFKFSKEILIRFMRTIGIWLVYYSIIALVLLGFGIHLVTGDQVLYTKYRVIDSSQALTLLQILIVIIINKIENNKNNLTKLFLPILLIIIIVQHKSIWVALAICIVTIFIEYRKNLINSIKTFMRYILTIVLILIIVMMTPIKSDILKSYDSIFNKQDSTLIEREKGWHVLLEEHNLDKNLNYYFGNPIGSGFARYQSGELVNYSPHNYYIETLLRIGYLGLGFFIALYLTMLIKIIKNRNLNLRYKNILITMLVSQIVYFYTYGPNFEQGIVLGICILGASESVVITKEKPLKDE